MNLLSVSKRWSSLALCLLALLFSEQAACQEINADVTVDRSQINSTSLSYMDNLSDEIETYLNEYTWTDTNFGTEERVRVDIQITLLSVDDNFNFDAQVIFRSRRPIYHTARETALFFYNEENWGFSYTPNRSLIHDRLRFDALTSFLDFYAYIILGYDFDSFDELGGTPYFSEAQNIVSQAPSTAPGWDRGSMNRRNRALLVAGLLNPNYEGLRLAMYQYHRQGLDYFVDDPEEARQQILKALQKIEQAKQTTASNLLFDTFFNTKYREIGNIFEDAKPEVRLEAYQLLSNIDQSHLSEYQKLQ
ncbi:DUF4835 family protein [Fodinibius sediminis]|uniref:DUF4835 domain-containing protein n=1 Tax=Fodinibius sediminis TaxID=1214077 RepID=A0A521D1A4_9BACT|nr:DUF4835 family protein [Fodinibius sediminis]SMO65454.1 protein of unknown function [Fodinibius sediminis]